VTQCVAVGSAVRGDVERSAWGVESIAHAVSEWVQGSIRLELALQSPSFEDPRNLGVTVT
jgi:hypothetical protein